MKVRSNSSMSVRARSHLIAQSYRLGLDRMQLRLRLLEFGAPHLEFGDAFGASRFEVRDRIRQRGFAQPRLLILLGQLRQLDLEFGALLARANQPRFALVDLIFEVAGDHRGVTEFLFEREQPRAARFDARRRFQHHARRAVPAPHGA